MGSDIHVNTAMTDAKSQQPVPEQDPAVLERAAAIPPDAVFTEARRGLPKGGLRHFSGRSPSLARAAKRDQAAIAKLMSRRAEAVEALVGLAFDNRPPKRVPLRIQLRALWLVLRLGGVRCPVVDTDKVLQRLAVCMNKPVPDDPDPDDISGMLHPIRIHEPKEREPRAPIPSTSAVGRANR